MYRITSRTLTILCLFFMTIGLIACGGGGGTSPSSGSGTLNLSLTDSSIDHIKAIYVTIAEVQVHKSGVSDETGNWQTILTPDHTYNLLDLVNGTLVSLGTAPLAAGSYDQLRLILKNPNYFVDNDNQITDLKVPSGLKTGIKIVGGFEIAAGQPTDLVLDFDAAKSLVRAGKSGKWLLKPTIKIAETFTSPIISGQVSNETDPLSGSLVSAQVYPYDPLVDVNGVYVKNATVTDANGMYLLYVPPATYNVVAVRTDYEPKCAVVTAVDSAETIKDFTLFPAEGSGTVSGNVTGLTGDDASATISVLRTMECNGGGIGVVVPVQVDSQNVAEGGNFTFTLPPGSYSLVVTAVEQTPQVFSVTVTTGSIISQDITF